MDSPFVIELEHGREIRVHYRDRIGYARLEDRERWYHCVIQPDGPFSFPKVTNCITATEFVQWVVQVMDNR